jgi:hypothetical protein
VIEDPGLSPGDRIKKIRSYKGEHMTREPEVQTQERSKIDRSERIILKMSRNANRCTFKAGHSGYST